MFVLSTKIDDSSGMAAAFTVPETLIGEINNKTMVKYESPEPRAGEESKKL